jgi:hypothetical protein
MRGYVRRASRRRAVRECFLPLRVFFRGVTTAMKISSEMPIGTRVMVRATDFWADGATGRLRAPPEEVKDRAWGWSGHVRCIPTRKGKARFYWVELDTPRRDGESGPFNAAEINADNLELMC